MVIDSLNGLERYLGMHSFFPKAFKFLKSVDLEALPTGRHEIDGYNVYALVSEEEGIQPEDAKLEVHDSYIDIQVLISGNESMGWRDRRTCDAEMVKYDEPNDIAYFEEEPAVYFTMEPYHMVIFFPHDAHAPMIGDGVIKKVVVKVRV